MMKDKRVPVLLLACILPLLFWNAAMAEEKGKEGPSPAAQLSEPVYKFDSILEGKEILHDFIVQNKGTAELDILKVQPG